MNYVLYALFSIVCLSSGCYSKNVGYNEIDLPGVIFVPGAGGCQLEARLNKTTNEHWFCSKKSDWYSVWLNYYEMAPGAIDCWVSNMVLQYDNTTHTTHPPPGVKVRVPQFGNTVTVEYLTENKQYSYFAYLAETLVALGYVRNKTLRGAPFDFRKAPNELGPYFTALRKLTEDLHDTTGGPVVLVAHSMGAPLLNYFLNMQTAVWRKTYVHSLVAMAGAWGGAVKALKVYAAGDSLGSRILSSLTMRTQQRTNPSLAFLLPDPELWGDEVLVIGPERNYTLRDMERYLLDLNLGDAYQVYLDTRNLLNKASTPPRVPLHCLYGTGMPTVERLQYASADYFPDYPMLFNGPGDGTVNLRSAELCNKYARLQSEPVSMQSYDNTDHMEILSNSGVLKYIAGLLVKEARHRATARNHSSLTSFTNTTFTAYQSGINGIGTSVATAGNGKISAAKKRVWVRRHGGNLTLIKTSNTLSDSPYLASSYVLSKLPPPVSNNSVMSNGAAISPTEKLSNDNDVVDVDAIIARVSSSILRRWKHQSREMHEVYEEMTQMRDIEDEMQRKKEQAQVFEITLARLRRHQE